MNTCALLTADMPARERPGLVQVEDVIGERAWGCPQHAGEALHGILGARIVADPRDVVEVGR